MLCGSQQQDQQTNTETNSSFEQNDFTLLTLKSGVILRKVGVPILKTNALNFRNTLNSLLKNHPQYPQILDTYVEQLTDCWHDIPSFRLFLSPMESSSSKNLSYFRKLFVLKGTDVLFSFFILFFVWFSFKLTNSFAHTRMQAYA